MGNGWIDVACFELLSCDLLLLKTVREDTDLKAIASIF
jgi:hypothetical protein